MYSNLARIRESGHFSIGGAAVRANGGEYTP